MRYVLVAVALLAGCISNRELKLSIPQTVFAVKLVRISNRELKLSFTGASTGPSWIASQIEN